MTEYIDFTFKDDTIILNQSAGFFSCCSIRLDAIIQYYRRFGKLPRKVDSTQQFRLYKLPGQENIDICSEFFCDPDYVNVKTDDFTTPSRGAAPQNFETVNYKYTFQELDYRRDVVFAPILPFVQKYFSPNAEILDAVSYFEQKYDLDYNNTCVLFYRGLDKVTEFPIPTYREVLERARKISIEHENAAGGGAKLRFLIQSDETEFIEAALMEFPDAIVFRDETRSARRQISSVDLLNDKCDNFFYVKLFFAIVLIMSRARYFVCNTGNISIWTCFYRGGANENVHQYLNWRYMS